jgi:hypothetical protein
MSSINAVGLLPCSFGVDRSCSGIAIVYSSLVKTGRLMCRIDGIFEFIIDSIKHDFFFICKA